MKRILVAALVAGCSAGSPVSVEVILPDGLDASGVEWRGARSRGASALVEPPAELTIDHPEACPTTVKVDGSKRRVEVKLHRFIELALSEGPVGFDSRFRVEVRAGCPAAEGGTVTFAQEGGPTLPEATTNGRTFVGRTHPLATLRPGPLPWGIVPLSEAQRGSYAIAATWHGPAHADVTARATVVAGARANGLPSLAVGTPVLLGGEGWRVTHAPTGAAASLVAGAGYATFVPRQSGRIVLTDGAGRELAVRVGRYDETPLDCGRAECHPRATEASATSPMTSVLARGLDGLLGPSYDPRCAIACHAAGQPGLPDGGFIDVARELGHALPARPTAGGWAHLPRILRRLGGVGCTACHGPGAIPEVAARWSILRADVCATCHDAPPRYPAVDGWRRGRMARSDASPGTGAEGCRDCHTTAGFLAAQGIRPLGAPPPDGVPPFGIACAACHAPHGAHGAKRLLRDVPVPAILGAEVASAASGESAVCLPCHAPRAGGGSSAAALWLGRGGLRVGTGAALVGPAPHAAIPCAGCHDGVGHSFATVAAACGRCHPGGAPATDGTIAVRARELAARLAVPGHAAGAPVGPAAWDVALVVEDPAAAVHNPVYARMLLDEAAR